MKWRELQRLARMDAYPPIGARDLFGSPSWLAIVLLAVVFYTTTGICTHSLCSVV